MPDLQFEGEQEYAPQYHQPETPVLVRWILATGFVRNARQAQYVLLAAAVLAGLLALFFFVSAAAGGIGPSGKTPPPPGVPVTQGFPPGS